MTCGKQGLITGRWGTSTRGASSNQRNPVVAYPGNPQGRHPNELGARGVYLVEVDDCGNANVEFRAVDLIRWGRVSVDISPLELEQGLLDALHGKMEDVLDSADGRSVVARVSITGRGELSRSLRRPKRPA